MTSSKRPLLFLGLRSSIVGLLGALYSFPAGYLSDRLGARRSLLIFNGLAMVGFLGTTTPLQLGQCSPQPAPDPVART